MHSVAINRHVWVCAAPLQQECDHILVRFASRVTQGGIVVGVNLCAPVKQKSDRLQTSPNVRRPLRSAAADIRQEREDSTLHCGQKKQTHNFCVASVPLLQSRERHR